MIIEYSIAQATPKNNINLGAILVACNQAGITRIILSDNQEQAKEELNTDFSSDNLLKDSKASVDYLGVILSYLDGKIKDLSALPLHLIASDYRLRLWQKMQQIPYGETITYGGLAEKVGKNKTAARSVGGACSANRHAIVIPCHRVVPANFASSNDCSHYRWGAKWKKHLLNLEKSQLTS